MEKARLLPVVFSSVLFLVTYWGILSGKLHRAIVSVVGAAAMVAAGTWIGFYRDEMAFRAIDFNTIGLLFGMMILVGLSQRAGIFRYLAIRAAKLTQGKPFLLLFVLSLLTAGLSAVLDNVTTIIVVAPVTVTIAGILGISAIPFLLSEVFLSNIGGAATLIGDPPNILIGSAARLSFTNMLTHLAPIAFAAAVLTGLVLLFLFRRELRTKWVGREAVAALDTAQQNLARLTTEVAGLRDEIRTAQGQRDQHFERAVALTDQIHQAQGEVKRLEERRIQLASQLASANLVLNRNGLHKDMPVDGLPPRLRGKVLAINRDNMVEVSLGSDDGLQAGHTLEIFRGSKYLGCVEILHATADRAVGKIIPGFKKGIIQKDDDVATRFKVS